ncbi:TIGR03087 family PEP-CTERM/XrtA system glycosyltransferase [Noviherbaspirillum denitrificans]|uniref:Sugar transferase n=1 Tax=Noviherbaspirillum denitrificans TaxID=1968433 RepID=A0A254THW7_9BURK|nr:TIGR03087 family PEP-CTERM/XrtA system glycosyltransferase [Noviherbaspirillum denitrificans]OWW22229.1 sugar transferase [Noviherbaspirillum denitrificans]
MEHLLYLVHRIPYPPNKGDKIRSYHLLRHLAERYHVHLGTFVDDADDWQHTDTVKKLCASTHFAALDPLKSRVRSLGALLTNGVLSVDYYRNAGLQEWVRQAMREHGISRVLVFSSPMAQYVMDYAQARRVIDFVDIDSDKWRQYAEKKPWPMSWLYGHEARQLLAYERHVAQRFDASLFVSQPEAEMFRQLAPESHARIGYFSNGVDTDYFAPSAALVNPYTDGKPAIAFTGAMDYWPNVDAVQWFADEVFPSVLKARPGAQFYIVGARPTAQVQALASRPGIHVTGTVPDVRPYIAYASVAVAPLRIARGIQNKVLEAMAMARPVVVSPQALEGIKAEPGRDIVLAQDAGQTVAAVNTLLSTPDTTIGAAARKKVIDLYGWTSNLSRVDSLLEAGTPAAMAC